MKSHKVSIIGIVIGILLFSGCSSRGEDVDKSDNDTSKKVVVENKEIDEKAVEPNRENGEVSKEENDKISNEDKEETSLKVTESKQEVTKKPTDKGKKPVEAPKTEKEPVQKPVEVSKDVPAAVDKPVEKVKEETPIVEEPKTETPPVVVAPYLDRDISNQLNARLLKYAPSSTNNHNRDSSGYSGTAEFHNKINSLVDKYTTNSITEAQLRAEIMALDGVERWSSLEEDSNRYHQIFKIIKIGKKEFPKGTSIEAMNEGVGRQMMEYGNYVYSSILVNGDQWIATYITLTIYPINK